MRVEDEATAHIIQMMPAPPGWEAVWGETYEPTKDEAGFHAELIACWALVTVGERTVVTAMLPDLESGELRLLSETPYFLGYRYPHAPTNWDQRATERRATVNQQHDATSPAKD